MNTVLKATWIGCISILLWGMLALLTRLTGGAIPAFQLMAMTFALAFLLMMVRWWCKGTLGLEYIKQPPFAWGLGVGGYFGYHFCYFLAMSKAPAVEVSLLAYLWPLLMVVFASLLPSEKLIKQHLWGALLALLGCWALIGKSSGKLSGEYIEGYLLALSCAIIWAAYSVASRLVKQVPTDAVGWFCLVTALLACICHLMWEETVWPQDLRQWVGVIGLGVGPVGVAFFTWDYGVKNGNLQLLGVLAYSVPLISTMLLLAAGEASAGINLLIACICIVGGSLLAGHAKSSP